MALHSVRSERLFCEQLDYNLLYRWFLNMDVDEPSFDHSTFSFNRERLLKHEVAEQFFAAVVSQAKARGLTSDEHFSADGTLIEAWASLKSFRPKDEKHEDREPPDDPGNPTVDFQQRDARVDNGPRGEAGAEVERPDGEAELLVERPHREQERAAGRDVARAGDGHR